MNETAFQELEAGARPRPRRKRTKARKKGAREKAIEVGGQRYRLDVEKREFQNIDDPTDRVSFNCGDPLIKQGDKYQFTGEENRILTIAAYNLTSDPTLTLQEAFHGCRRDGHVFVHDWDRDLEFNEHYLLHPKKCKFCGLKVFETEAVTKSVCPPHVMIQDPDREVTTMKDYKILPYRCARCGQTFSESVKIHSYGDVR